MSIFTCGICIKDYNDYNKKPLSLPCGHVFCEECISKKFSSDSMGNGIKCPSDSLVHKIELSKIPICAQILVHLPKQQKKTNIIHCMRHPNKKIKYFCRTHNVFPCSICVVEHTDHDLACFESNQSAFFSEVKTLSEQVNSNKEHFLQNKSKSELNERMINDHFTMHLGSIDRYYERLFSCLKEKKRTFVNELNVVLNEMKKSYENRRKIDHKMTERYSELGNKVKHIEELYNKGEYEVFHLLKQKVINEIKAINEKECSEFNVEALPEFIPGQYTLMNNICGEIKLKINKNNKPMGMVMNMPSGVEKERENDQSNNEDTKSIDSMTTMMIIANDTNNVFKQNLLKASENETQYASLANSNDASTLQSNPNSNYQHIINNSNNYKYPYQQYVSPCKPEQSSSSSPLSNLKLNTPQTNRDIAQMNKQSQHNSDKKITSIAANYNSNCNSINKNSQRQELVNQIQPKASIMNTSNTSANKKEVFVNEKHNKITNYNRPRLKTESSLEKSNSNKVNKDKGESAKYTPLVSSPGISEVNAKEDKSHPKRLPSQKKKPNTFNVLCNNNLNGNNDYKQGPKRKNSTSLKAETHNNN